MSQWKEYKLGDLVTFQRGHDLPRSEMKEGVFPVAGSNGIIGFHNEFTTKAPSITIGRSGSIGNPFLHKTDFWAHNTTLYVKEFKKVDPIFFYYLLLTLDFNYLNSGSAVPSLNRNYIHPFVVKIPENIETQTAIASILSSLDEKIELNNAINRNLEALAQALFKQWFVEFNFPVDQHGNFSHLSGEMSEGQRGYKDSGGELVESELGMIPKGWRVGVLSDVIYFSNGYAFNSKELQSSDIGDCYHVFKMGHIKKGGGLNSNGTKSYFERSKSEKLKKYVLTIGDLLMCMTDMKGNVALLGHTALMNENDKYIVNQRVGLLRPKNDIGIDYPYLYILTNSTDFIEDLRSRANSGVQVNLSTSEIKNSRIIIPPTNINIAFNNVATPLFYNIFNSSKENDELSKLRDTLLPKLISGELEVKDVNWG